MLLVSVLCKGAALIHETVEILGFGVTQLNSRVCCDTIIYLFLCGQGVVNLNSK